MWHTTSAFNAWYAALKTKAVAPLIAVNPVLGGLALGGMLIWASRKK